MAKTITDLYDADDTAGEPENITGNEKIVFDASPEKNEIQSKSMTISQLVNVISPPDSPLGTFNINTSVNSLVANITPITDIVYTHYALQIDNSVAPIIGDLAFVYGTIPLSFNMPDWNVHDYYLWVHDGASVTQIYPTPEDDNNNGGLTIQAEKAEYAIIAHDPDVTTTINMDFSPLMNKLQGDITGVAFTLGSGLVEEAAIFSVNRVAYQFSGGVDGTYYDLSCQITYKHEFTGDSVQTPVFNLPSIYCANVTQDEQDPAGTVINTFVRES